jgi:hypothetical protein
MYNIIYYITILLTAINIIVADKTTTNALISINNPKVNQMLIPNQQIMLQYTINGIPTSTYRYKISIYDTYK